MQSASISERVADAVRSWSDWLPTWRIDASSGGRRICRRCLGSPVLRAAGIGRDVPHPVTHALAMRMHQIVDSEVDDYISAHLPELARRANTAERARSRAAYQPHAHRGFDYLGLDLDPDPLPEQPFLFTLGGIAQRAEAEVPSPLPAPDEAEKAVLQQQIMMADAASTLAGERVCLALAEHRPEIAAEIVRYVEPQIENELAGLFGSERELQSAESSAPGLF